MQQGAVPPPLKKQGPLAISTLDVREIAIMAVCIGLAVAILFSLPGSLTLRIFLGSLVGGGGIALAFATIQGEKLETWLYRSLMFQLSNRKLSVWRRGEAVVPRPAPFEETAPQPEPASPPPARFHRPVRPEVAGDLSFLSAMANVVIFSIFAALSTYMATGGAQQLVDYISFLARR